MDALIGQARTREMKIGLLWFGTWKNAQCSYVPEWVKTNLTRFWRTEVEKPTMLHVKLFSYGDV